MLIKTGKDLAAACKKVATDHDTLYVMGCFGAPMNDTNKTRYMKHHGYNRLAARAAKIKAAHYKTFGFDCVCLIKGLLWGWDADPGATYGGATYKKNGVPDINADAMIMVCNDVSADFSKIAVGEFLWMEGHCGVYIGGGLAVECTPIWKDGVQITAVLNIGKQTGYHGRRWEKHGKLPYVEYSVESVEIPEDTIDELAREVIAGKWGSGADRQQRLTAAGYNYRAVQNRVNELLLGITTTKTIDELAREVIAGKWGSGADRQQRLTAAGYNYRAVQNRVNELMKK